MTNPRKTRRIAARENNTFYGSVIRDLGNVCSSVYISCMLCPYLAASLKFAVSLSAVYVVIVSLLKHEH